MLRNNKGISNSRTKNINTIAKADQPINTKTRLHIYKSIITTQTKTRNVETDREITENRPRITKPDSTQSQKKSRPRQEQNQTNTLLIWYLPCEREGSGGNSVSY